MNLKMGIFDFLSKGKSKPAANANPQNPQNAGGLQSYPNSGYSDLQYPIPAGQNANPQSAPAPLPGNGSIPGMTYLSPVQQSPNPSPVLEATGAPVPDQDVNSEHNIPATTKMFDPNAQTETLPDGIKVTTYGDLTPPMNNNPVVNTPVAPLDIMQSSPTDFTVPVSETLNNDALTQSVTQPKESFAVKTPQLGATATPGLSQGFTPTQGVYDPMAYNFGQSPTQNNPNVTATTPNNIPTGLDDTHPFYNFDPQSTKPVPSTEPLPVVANDTNLNAAPITDSLDLANPSISSPAVIDNNITADMEIKDRNNPDLQTSTFEQIPEKPVEDIIPPLVTPVVKSTVIDLPVEIDENTDLDNLGANIEQQALQKPNVQPEILNPVSSTLEIEPAMVPLVSNQMTDVISDSKVNDIESFDDNVLKIFKKVGFISLNIPSVNPSLGKKLKRLVELLAAEDLDFLIDSNKGYGMDIITSLANMKNKVTGVYLKPYYTSYSDEAEIATPIENFTTVMFSDLLEKVKYFLKNAQVFIVPETSGLNNYAQLFFLTSLQYFYLGQHKPVILFGTAWKVKLQEFKKTLGIDDNEMKSFILCETPESVIDTLKKIDDEYSSRPPLKIKRVIDMRDGDDEKDYLISE